MTRHRHRLLVLFASIALAVSPLMVAPVAAASLPTRWVGSGTASSCTSARVVAAVKRGGIVRFRCGRKPVVIRMKATAKVYNARPDVVIDGGGKVTLDGGGDRRIIYMNTCDQALGWTTSHCNDQAHPTLTIRGITLRNRPLPRQRLRRRRWRGVRARRTSQHRQQPVLRQPLRHGRPGRGRRGDPGVRPAS